VSLIVTFNGQFKPNPIPYDDSHQLRRIRKMDPLFNDLLNKISSEDLPKETTQNLKQASAKVQTYQKSAQNMKRKFYARDIMTTEVETLTVEHTLKDAIELLDIRKFRHIPILKDQQLYGIISDRLILKLLSQGKTKGTKLEEIMTKEVISALENTSITDISRAFLNRKINCVPIVDEKLNLKGIVTSTDLMNLLIVSSEFISYA
tara:strand:- start:2019 stop:2633 length:615 start_codon:yes stop_codon:yes gene_type:complete